MTVQRALGAGARWHALERRSLGGIVRARLSPVLAGVLLGLALPAPTSAAEKVRLWVDGRVGSEAYQLARALADPLARELGRPVALQQGNGAETEAAERMVGAAPDGSDLLLANNLSLALAEVSGEWSFALEALRPIAKLTLGISVALVVPERSEIDGWQALVTLAERRSPTLSLSDGQPAYDVARAMIERESDIAFDGVRARDGRASMAEVAEGRAELALVTTNAIAPFNAGSEMKLRPIVTFGAERSPRYPETPTFAELTGDDKNDFTYSFAIFGPPDLPDEQIERLGDALRNACRDPAAAQIADAHGLRLTCHDAEVVRQTLERDLQVARAALGSVEQ